jgi:O-antigen/teichoic acid export membrane protein
MNAYYLLSVLGNRLLALLTVLVLSFLLSPDDFGVFTIILTNALLFHLLYSSWISNSSWKSVSIGDEGAQKVSISASLGYASLLSLAPLCISAALLVIDYERFYYVGITLILAVTILFFELVMVIKNAQGLTKDHGATSLLRGGLTFSFSVALTWLGFGVRGAIFGQILGTAATILCQRSFWMMWRHFERGHVLRSGIAAQVRFGLISVFALNLYLMGNALCRNVILLGLGEAEAGYFSLSADMFYAPIAMFAMTASLSSIPELYRLAGSDTASSHASDFIGGVLAVAIPYALAGLFVGPSVAHFFLGSNLSVPIAQIAPHSIIHAACFCVLSTQTTIALTQGRLKIAVGLPVVTLALIAGVLLAAYLVFGPDRISLLRYAEAVTAALLLITAAILGASRAVLRVPIQWGECLRVLGASLAMCVVLAALARFPLPFEPIPAIALGGATFLGAAWLLRSRIVRNLVRLSAA